MYWGSNTISERIPTDCFIDRRQFNSTQEVHRYLKSMDAQTYARFQKNIAGFLASPAALAFDTTQYVSIIRTRILNDLGV